LLAVNPNASKLAGYTRESAPAGPPIRGNRAILRPFPVNGGRLTRDCAGVGGRLHNPLPLEDTPHAHVTTCS